MPPKLALCSPATVAIRITAQHDRISSFWAGCREQGGGTFPAVISEVQLDGKLQNARVVITREEARAG